MSGTRISRFVTLLGCLIAIGQSASAAESTGVDKPHFLNSPQASERGLPFSEAVRAGNFIFLSGQIGGDETMRLVPGGIVAESRQVLKNIQSTLERYGSSLADVVKCTVFLTDMAEWEEFNKVYREVFKAPFPARSALGVSALALGARVEVECIAYAPGRRQGE